MHLADTIADPQTRINMAISNLRIIGASSGFLVLLQGYPGTRSSLKMKVRSRLDMPRQSHMCVYTHGAHVVPHLSWTTRHIACNVTLL